MNDDALNKNDFKSVWLDSPIGFVKITGNANYIISISFHDEQIPVELPESEDEKVFLSNAREQLENYFDGKLKEFTFPFLQEGTHFQQAVWKELLHIPYGKIITYLELAKRLGNVKQIRAAGNANGKNQLAIVVPCHRVIGSKGELVGYAGELWRKEWLLNHEGAIPKKLF